MSHTTWIVCAAGEGTRFRSLGISTSKPTIRVNGKSFLEISISCLDIKVDDQLIIIAQRSFGLRSFSVEIQCMFPGIEIDWVELDALTKGQLDTFTKCSSVLNMQNRVVIWNCDSYFKASSLNLLMDDIGIDAVIPCGKMKGDHWSFCNVDANLNVFGIVEKVRVSEWATVGFYFFRDARLLLEYSYEILQSDPADYQTEYYISGVYKKYIENNKTVRCCPIDEFLPFGTPEEVETSFGISLEKLIEENSHD